MSLGFCQFKSKLNPGLCLIDNRVTGLKPCRKRNQGSQPGYYEMEIALKDGNLPAVCKICAK